MLLGDTVLKQNAEMRAIRSNIGVEERGFEVIYLLYFLLISITFNFEFIVYIVYLYFLLGHKCNEDSNFRYETSWRNQSKSKRECCWTLDSFKSIII